MVVLAAEFPYGHSLSRGVCLAPQAMVGIYFLIMATFKNFSHRINIPRKNLRRFWCLLS